MSVFKRGKVWWYEFWFAGRRIQESAKATSKTVAKLAEQKRRRELEEGFNAIEDRRDERIRTIREVAKEYLGARRAVAAGNLPLGWTRSTKGQIFSVFLSDRANRHGTGYVAEERSRILGCRVTMNLSQLQRRIRGCGCPRRPLW